MANELEITVEETRAMIAAADLSGIMSIAEEDAYAQYLSGQLSAELIAADAQLYGALLSSLTGTLDEAALNKSREIATRQAKQITGQMTQTELNKVAKAIYDGAAAGQHPDTVARTLDSIKGLDQGRAGSLRKYTEYLDTLDISKEEWERRAEVRYQKLLSDRKKTIAQNEMRIVSEEGNELDARERGDKFKFWMTSADESVCPICGGNQAQGVIPINEAFQSGHQRPPGHPGNCRCTNQYVHEKEDVARMRVISEELQDQTEAAEAVAI